MRIFVCFCGLLVLWACSDDLNKASVARARNDKAYLVAMLKGADDWKLRERCVMYLGQSLDREVVPFLLQAAQDIHPAVRIAALDSLKVFVDESIYEGVVQSLDDESPHVRIAGLECLTASKYSSGHKELHARILRVAQSDADPFVQQWATHFLTRLTLKSPQNLPTQTPSTQPPQTQPSPPAQETLE